MPAVLLSPAAGLRACVHSRFSSQSPFPRPSSFPALFSSQICSQMKGHLGADLRRILLPGYGNKGAILDAFTADLASISNTKELPCTFLPLNLSPGMSCTSSVVCIPCENKHTLQTLSDNFTQGPLLFSTCTMQHLDSHQIPI